MSDHHHHDTVHGATGIGARAVVIREGTGPRTERRTVVDESERTITVDDGTRFSRATGLAWSPEPLDTAELDAVPPRVVTEGHPDFEQWWADAVLSAFTDTDHVAYVEGRVGANRPARRGDVHERYDVAAVVDELAAVHPDLEAVPEDLFWAVVDRHARDEDRDITS